MLVTMKIRTTITALALVMSLAGCENLGGIMDVVSIDDAQARALSEESCKAFDAKSKIEPANSKYTKRLNKIAKNLGNQVDGIPLNYKVYRTNDINAWAMANGCVRVFSGLMDEMTDDEVQGVLGHEIGHVALGHSKKAMQTAYAASKAREAMGKYGGSTGAKLAQNEYADLAEELINSQFSQHQESEADNYSYDLLKKKNLNRQALVSAFRKIGNMGGSNNVVNQLFSTHPDAMARADAIQARIDADK